MQDFGVLGAEYGDWLVWDRVPSPGPTQTTRAKGVEEVFLGGKPESQEAETTSCSPRNIVSQRCSQYVLILYAVGEKKERNLIIIPW